MTETQESSLNSEEQLNRIAELESENKELRDLLTYDEITGLPQTQRKFGRKLILRSIEEIHQSGQRAGLLRLDLNGLKKWNFEYGHDETDKLLWKFAERLREWAKTRRGVAMRFHNKGDEFGILLPCQDVDSLTKMTNDLVGFTITDPREEELICDFSIGYASEGEGEVSKMIMETEIEEGKRFEGEGRLFMALSKVADDRERVQERIKGQNV